MLLNRKLWGRFSGFSFIYNVCFAKFVTYNFQKSDYRSLLAGMCRRFRFFVSDFRSIHYGKNCSISRVI